ncbi:hypothetical protein ACFC26_29880 [Kitasatospora purpeofusca]|uniref:hypothetical protein n=1 Tax=Kitasatospora purpeofusca TaxID=67352 RepID=UPI0035D66C57
MAETDQPTKPEKTGVCPRCGKTGPVFDVGYVEQTTGPGWTVWGCADCEPFLRVLIG